MSTASNIPLFGRKWDLQVLTDPTQGNQSTLLEISASDWEPEALKIQFEVVQQISDAWYAEIAIYNLNVATEQALITQGCEVILSAGYQQGLNYGVIFQGRVFQPLWERENVTDYKITLHCFVGLEYFYGNHVSMSIGPLATQAQFIANMAQSAHTTFDTSLVDAAQLSQVPESRASVAFGSVAKYFQQIGRENDLAFWCGGQSPALGSLVNISTASPDVTYAPPLPVGTAYKQDANVTYSILGTPRQTTDGVTFRIMLDSRMILKKNPPVVVQLNMTQIKQIALYPGNLLAPFELSGNYLVAGVRHTGDSRSNEWVTEVVAVTPNALLQQTGGGA